MSLSPEQIEQTNETELDNERYCARVRGETVSERNNIQSGKPKETKKIINAIQKEVNCIVNERWTLLKMRDLQPSNDVYAMSPNDNLISLYAASKNLIIISPIPFW